MHIMSSGAGSTAFFVVSLVTIVSLVVLLLRYYLPLRTTPAYVTVPVFLAIALPASIVVLLPIDLASSAGTDTGGARGIWLSDKVVYKSWRVIYWLTFALTWAILPMLGEYCDSGYREPKARMVYALRSNGQYWLVVLACSVVGSIYLVWANGFQLDTFQSLIMALAYAWGLVLGIYLMGHGLVAFPRSLFRYANVGERLKRIQSQAPRVHDKLTEALEKLDDYEAQVVQLRQRKNGITKEFHAWINELADKSNLPENRAGVASTTTIPPVITERYLAELTRKLKRARHAKCRFENEWDHIIRKAVRTQAILDSKGSKRLEFKTHSSASPGFLDRITLHTAFTRYHTHVHIIPALTYLTWAITLLASLSIVWSECVREAQDFGGPKLSIIGWTVMQRHSTGRSSIGFNSQLTAALWLCYMCICAFYSLTEVKIWGNRALVRRNTYQESATWYGLQVAKLTVPLSYNFLTMTDKNIWKDTQFYNFLGRLIVLSPLGKGFSAFFPIFILVPVFATAFGLYGKIKNICGFGDLLDDEEGQDGQLGASSGEPSSWREGRALIDRELQNSHGATTLGLANRQHGGNSPLNVSAPPERYSDSPTPGSGSGPATARSASPLPLHPPQNDANHPSSSATALLLQLDSSSSSTTRPYRPERRRPLITDEEDDPNFFETFANRVKNTFETNDFSFKRPKWLGGDDEVEAGERRRAREGGNAGGSGQDRMSGFRSLFGGRPDEGRVRL